jgi:DNA-binding Lrp family transcriptional regulator
MNIHDTDAARYSRCLTNARKVNWDIDQDVIRFRTLDVEQKYLPDTLSKVNELEFLSADEQRFLSQIQGRTYAYIFGLVERFINCKVLELSAEHALGDQAALEAMVNFSKEELKHQELFRRVEKLADATLPPGYTMTVNPNDVARAVLSKSTWAVLALTCHIEIFTQVHYKESIKPDEGVSELFNDIFRFHWLEEAQHATLDELEWSRVHASLSDAEIDAGVNDLIELVGAVDGILQAQSASDAEYFMSNCDKSFSKDEAERIRNGVLKAYRWQYIVSGMQVPRFQKALTSKISDAQMARIMTAAEPIITSVAA